MEVIDNGYPDWGSYYRDKMSFVIRNVMTNHALARVEVGPAIARWIGVPCDIAGIPVILGDAMTAEGVRFITMQGVS